MRGADKFDGASSKTGVCENSKGVGGTKFKFNTALNNVDPGGDGHKGSYTQLGRD
jgi:hypothetical protein